ncbi:MAG: 50S ribosomal protein L1 [Planctomycetaceae bacterium]|nr:MAG: 50S ribosomal protein L1 [Planctomycetaceae bacterium]
MGKVRSKRYRKCLEKVPPKAVGISEAITVLKGFDATKFDSTVNLVVHLGIDPKQADQALRGAISMPHGIGQSKKVIAFCDGDDIAKAKEAGAIEAGADDLIKKVNDGWLDFDVAIATPAMMKNVSRLGRVLGPQGKMPSPKAGTVVTEIAPAVREYAAGKVEFRNDDYGNLHVVVGKMSFDAEKLAQNISAFLDHVRRIKPASSKGTYIKKAVVSGTMTPGVQLDVQ